VRHDSPGRSGTAFKERQTLMDEDIPLPFDLPAVARKVSAAFDGGRITSDGGVMLFAQAERRLDIADRLARVIPDERDVDRIIHLLPDILRPHLRHRLRL
jgi:DDE family transposase